jgi:O-antigen/teichoic acid export membrane protein
MNLSYFKTSKTIRQVAILFASNILLIGIGFGIKKIQTQQLGEINYGEYAFFISLVTFLSLFFRFGFFVSLQNLLAQNHNEIRKKKLLAIGFTMALINGIALSVIVWLLSHFVNDIFKTNIEGRKIR